jgi:pilus assembly protein CpaD
MTLRPIATFAALLVAGCNISPDMAETDYRQKYPVQVHAETAVMTARLTEEAGILVAEDEFRLSRLVAGYLDRGHGPMFVSATSQRHAEALRLRLMAAGIPASGLAMMPGERGTPDSVTFRYDRFQVALPRCGDWSSDATSNHSNDVHANFGCTLQRNFGLMVADPADLVRMRDAQPADAQNAGRVMQKYRAGQSPATLPSDLHKERAIGSIVAK